MNSFIIGKGCKIKYVSGVIPSASYILECDVAISKNGKVGKTSKPFFRKGVTITSPIYVNKRYKINKEK